MSETKDIVLTPEQKKVLGKVEKLVLSAISKECAGCSTAHFAPNRLGMAVALGRASRENVAALANQFRGCIGLTEESTGKVCHYPPPPKAEIDQF